MTVVKNTDHSPEDPGSLPSIHRTAHTVWNRRRSDTVFQLLRVSGTHMVKDTHTKNNHANMKGKKRRDNRRKEKKGKGKERRGKDVTPASVWHSDKTLTQKEPG